MTKISEDRLRTLYEPIGWQAPLSREQCATPEQLQAVVDRAGDEDERLAILDHVMACGACRSEFDLLKTVDRAGIQLVQEDLQTSKRGAARGAVSWRWPLTAIAAAALIAVGLQSYRKPSSADDPRVMRGITDPVTLVVPVADAVVDVREPVRFVWNSVARSLEYELEVLDSAGQIVYTTTTTDTSALVAIPTERIDRATPYRWWVRASMPDGERLRSPMRAIRFQNAE